MGATVIGTGAMVMVAIGPMRAGLLQLARWLHHGLTTLIMATLQTTIIMETTIPISL